jgi:hypothetical protein
MPSLDSPGKATSERARLEEELSASLLRALRFFLMDVEKLAMAPAPAMTASLFDGGNRGHGLTLGGVLGKWTHAARTAIKPVARVFGVHDLTDEAIAAHPYLSQMFDRMSRSDLPEKAYSAARAVLSEAATQGWAHDKVALEMGRAMNAWTATLVPGRDGPVPEGMSWAAQMQRIARTESTAAYNFSAIERLSAQGYPQKQWVAHHDKITRDTHLAADGQVVPLTAAFIVGGQALMVPGDPAGSPAVTYNCRCVIVGAGSGDPLDALTQPYGSTMDMDAAILRSVGFDLGAREVREFPPGSVILRRGVAEAEYVDDFFGPSDFVGKGIYGNGYYFTQAGNALLDRGYYGRHIIEAVLDPSAKVIDRDSLIAEVVALREAGNPRMLKMLEITKGDEGMLAALLGYDAVTIPVDEQTTYWLIVNRAKLLARRAR